jgi:hypothetical protein
MKFYLHTFVRCFGKQQPRYYITSSEGYFLVKGFCVKHTYCNELT